MIRRPSSAPRSTRSPRPSIEAAVIVIVVIFLFLGNLRSTFIPIVTIPLSLVGVMIALHGAWLFDQPADAARAGARHRARRRRRDRGGREHSSPHRGGDDAVRRGDKRRARNRAADHRHDDHAGRGLCADRIRLRRDRRPLSRVRLHACRRGHRLRLHRADAVADDVLEAPAPRKERELVRPDARPLVPRASARL